MFSSKTEGQGFNSSDGLMGQCVATAVMFLQKDFLCCPCAMTRWRWAPANLLDDSAKFSDENEHLIFELKTSNNI